MALRNLVHAIYRNFFTYKIENFIRKKKSIFFLFLRKNKKNRYTPANPSFLYKSGVYKGVYIARTCFPDGSDCIIKGICS